MGQKHYSKAIRNEAVLFYERGRSFAETRAKYGMAESTFFEWKKRFDQEPPLYEPAGGSTKAARNAQLHLEKLALELEVVRQCPCGINASIDDKIGAINALSGRYSIRVLCEALNLPRGTYYNRKRRENQLT